eukprot:15106631-Alexandrium_andersonii.AAC.1
MGRPIDEGRPPSQQLGRRFAVPPSRPSGAYSIPIPSPTSEATRGHDSSSAEGLLSGGRADGQTNIE